MVGSLMVPGSQDHHLRDNRLMKVSTLLNYEPDRDENISKDDCLQSNHIDMNSFEKWRLLGCRIDQMDEVQFQLNSVFIYSWNINLKFTKMKK